MNLEQRMTDPDYLRAKLDPEATRKELIEAGWSATDENVASTIVSRAHGFLRTAEEFHHTPCVEALLDAASVIKAYPLGDDFWPRVIEAQRRLKALGKSRPRKAIRDNVIRIQFHCLMNNSVYAEYGRKHLGIHLACDAVSYLAETYGVTEKAIEEIIYPNSK
jgi:hypothetical protein